MSGTYLLASLLCLALGSALGSDVLEGSYNVTAVCTTVKIGTSLGSTLSCSYYYSCTPSGPVKATCPNGYLFSLSSQTCVTAGQSNCAFNQGNANPCIGNSGSNWVQGTHCNSWTYCQNSVAIGSGMCPLNEKFDSRTQQCVFGSCPTTDSSISGSYLCNVVPPNIYFGSADNCATWNYCSSTQGYHTDSCPTNSVFIVESGLCGPNSNGVCNRVNSVPTAAACTASGQVMPDPNICGNYLICNGDLTTTSYPCPYGQYFDAKKSVCMIRQAATPISTCNICQYATTAFVNAVNTDSCNSYYYCAHGQMEPALKPNTCPTNYFFDVEMQGCVKYSSVDVTTYALDHGACHGATDPTVAAPPSPPASTTTTTKTT